MENKVLQYNSSFVGTAIFMFGFLKFFDPFNTWFHIQIAKSGLPPFFIPLGMAGEMSIGLSLLLATVFRERIRSLFRPVSCLGLSRPHRHHGGGDLCPFAAGSAGKRSSVGNKTAAHPSVLHAFGGIESLSALSSQ